MSLFVTLVNGTYIFKLSQLHCLYESRLSTLHKGTRDVLVRTVDTDVIVNYFL